MIDNYTQNVTAVILDILPVHDTNDNSKVESKNKETKASPSAGFPLIIRYLCINYSSITRSVSEFDLKASFVLKGDIFWHDC